MTTTMIENKRSGERGNVLFLILIAVALFAALSYAVTQSTRSGSGDASGETALISSAQLTQYPAGIRTSIVRMVIAGTDVNELKFNPPSDFDQITTEDEERTSVFHPQGGGAVFTNAPADMMASSGVNSAGNWYFNMKNQIQDIGLTDAASNAGNDLIAYLPGVTQTVCRKMNEELGLGSTIPTGEAAYVPSGAQEGATDDFMNDSYPALAATPDEVIGDGASDTLKGQPFGCYDAGGTTYVYYHVLVER
ncbi:hypothetical protein [Micavibrio aeruginosavorus]|uniref:hypothetical protein n=1 Tax=Micavibrio aeruginosavorus TaxID=349221 RepID=UPI003F4AA93D